MKDFNPIRYSVITEKNPREIVMLRGNGCKWLKCRFCNYHPDSTKDEQENFMLNKAELDKVMGMYGKLEVINSGSFVDLDEKTLDYIRSICVKKNINEVHFECHWMHRKDVPEFKNNFAEHGIKAVIKTGVETFDSEYREKFLVKGIDTDTPREIARYFDEVCLLHGLKGQTKESMIYDIETGLKYFDRVCVNIMVENGMPVKPDSEVIKLFIKEVMPLYIDNERVDILLNNTDFGVG